jgi:hypothetical protein
MSAAATPQSVNPPPLAILTNHSPSNDEFGTTVAISADWRIVAVGASANEGAVYIYVEPSTGWTSTSAYTAKLATGSSQVSGFGYSVAISPDGKIIAAGAPNATSPTGSQGVILIFEEPANGWVSSSHATAELYTNGTITGGSLGGFVATNGNTVAAGVPQGPYGASAAFVFVQPSTGWHSMAESAILSPSDNTIGDDLGAVAISGNTIVVGGPQNETVSGEPGAAYVYVKPASGWSDMTETARLTASDAKQYDDLGVSVAIRGSTIAVGANEDNVGPGAAYIFVEPAGGWKSMTETAEFTPVNGSLDDWFGFAVALTANANVLVVGEPEVFVGNTGQASAYVKPTGGWKTTSSATYNVNSPAGFESFGAALAASANVVAIGANYISDSVPGGVVLYGEK